MEAIPIVMLHLDSFIDIVNGTSDLSEAKQLEIIHDILVAAGFEFDSIERGVEYKYNRDEDGSALDRYVINPASNIRVINNLRAIYWLQLIWNRTQRLFINDKAAATEFLMQEILRSTPLKPVVITKYGDALIEYPPNMGLVDHTKDDAILNSPPGVHRMCHGWMDIHKISPTHNAISCRSCHLRVAFPNTIKTYGELRTHFKSLQGG